MAGFLRKVAGAFVEIEDAEPSASKARRGAPGLDAITDDAAQLLAQLESHAAAPAEARPAAASARGPAPRAAAAGSAMGMTADDVFVAAGIADGPNSAERLLKLIAGLKMFPIEQQVVMIRAMDAADESWAEGAVLEDARARQSALRVHLQTIDGERAERRQALEAQIAATRAEGQSICDDIDKRIAELQAKRQEAVVQTTAAISDLEGSIRQLETDAEKSRRGITQVINALSGLITFFTGGGAKSPGGA